MAKKVKKTKKTKKTKKAKKAKKAKKETIGDLLAKLNEYNKKHGERSLCLHRRPCGIKSGSNKGG